MLKTRKRFLSLLTASAILLSGCVSKSGSSGSGNTGSSSSNVLGETASSSDPTVNMVKNHAFDSDYPDTPFVDVINKFVDSPQWMIKSEGGAERVTVTGNLKNIDKVLTISVLVSDDPEDENMSKLDVDKYMFGNMVVNATDAWYGMFDIYDCFDGGKSDLTELNDAYMSYYDYPLTHGFEWVDIPIALTNSSGVNYITGIIKNVSHDPTYAKVRFSLYDASENYLGIAYDEVDQLKVGDTWTFAAVIPDSFTTFSLYDFNSFGTSKYDAADFEKTTVKALYDELNSNALRAETTYQDKLLEVTGYISTIDSDGKYFSITDSDSSWDYDSLRISFTDDAQKNAFMSKNRGDRITVRVKITSIGEILGFSGDLMEIL